MSRLSQVECRIMWKTYALVQSIAHLYVVLRLPATEADAGGGCRYLPDVGAILYEGDGNLTGGTHINTHG